MKTLPLCSSKIGVIHTVAKKNHKNNLFYLRCGSLHLTAQRTGAKVGRHTQSASYDTLVGRGNDRFDIRGPSRLKLPNPARKRDISRCRGDESQAQRRGKLDVCVCLCECFKERYQHEGLEDRSRSIAGDWEKGISVQCINRIGKGIIRR